MYAFFELNSMPACFSNIDINGINDNVAITLDENGESKLALMKI